MAEARYMYTKTPRDDDKLDAEIRALGLPGYQGFLGSGEQIILVFDDALSADQQTSLLTVINNHVAIARRLKKTLAVANELLAYIAVPDAQPGFVKRLAAVAAGALAGAMQTNPNLAKQVGAAIDADEPAP